MKPAIAVLVLLVVGVGMVYTQTPPPSPPDLPKVPSLGLPAIPEEKPAAEPKEPTIDELLNKIEKIREQKAELDKQEQAAVAEVKKRMVKQTERLNKLGLGAPVPAPPPVVNFTAPEAGPAIIPGAAPAPPLPQPRGR
jgi:hypothetical protein